MQNSTLVEGWGRATRSRATVVTPGQGGTDEDWAAVFAGAGSRGLIARGGGRSYGDAAQNAGGLVLDMRGQGGIGTVDPVTATVEAGAGVTVGELVRHLAPRGWTLPVVPGSAGVTVGGAIAADVHGKNHRRHGTFGAQVAAMSVLTPAYGPMEMSLTVNAEQFWATVGGLGLTGIIRRARLRLIPLGSWWVTTVDDEQPSLDRVLERLRAVAATSEHAVAWVDHGGAGVVTGARPARLGALVPGRVAAGRRTPVLPGRGIAWPPVSAAADRVRRFAARIRPRHERSLAELHFPLDALPGWAGLHGRRGLVQYQFTVPFGAEDVLAEALHGTRSAGFAPSLSVLKLFAEANPAPLSFPAPGWSLAMDFAARAALAPVLDRLDERVAAAGGRVYLVKDSRVRPDLLDAMYPGLARWRAVRSMLDPEHRLVSDLARRLRLTDQRISDLVEAGHA
ncbi:FAD-binding protein [Actinoplanes sp. L3-i22]|uniref:FAD-dependent oxidoreductase n=1 Tax=Actinoplanes sp. L3-i22 TaxID=2836373 RepID=UPI001C849EEF|nr:FAD-binding oxidoreductase [Actinoplanes sp. L3-i22]